MKLSRKVVSILLLIAILLGSSPLVVAAKFSIGDTVEVYNTGGSGLIVRDVPAGNYIGGKFDGARGVVLAGPQSASLGGVVYTWWKVHWADDGLEGWSAENWLMKVTPPDLIVEDIWIYPESFNPGSAVTIYTRIRNIGAGVAASGQGLWIKAYFDGGLCYQEGMEGLGAGYAYTFQWGYTWPSNTNWHTIEVRADPSNYIPESNEGNNIRSESFQATAPTNNPPTLSNGYVTPSSGETSTTFSYYVTYSDPEGDAPTTKYVYIDGSPYTMTQISGGYLSGAVFRYSTSLSAGSHNYYFYFADSVHNHVITTSISYEPTVTQPTVPRALTVYTSPSGVAFTANGEAHTTPWSGTYAQGTSINLVMPSPYADGDARYYWDKWNDGTTSSSRTITLNSDTTVTGSYIGPYYELIVDSSPISGIPFTVGGASKITSYSEWLYQGYYTIEMPASYNGYVWQHWHDDAANRVRTVLLTTSTYLTAHYLVPSSPDFSISASPTSLTIQQGSSDSSTITVTSLNGFDQSVSLQVDSRFLPPGVTASLSLQSVKPPSGGSATSTLTVSVSTEAPLVERLMAVIGTCGALEHPEPISLKIVARPSGQVFNPPFEASSLPGAGWDESLPLTGGARHVSTADRSVGNGEIGAHAWSTIAGDGKAFAKITFEDSWINEWSGETRAKATINVNGIVQWIAASALSDFPLDIGAGGQGIFFDACLRVYDYSTATEIWRKDLPIYHYMSDWEFAPLLSCGGDSRGFRDSSYIVQGLMDLETGHTYIWTFEAQLYVWSWSIELGFGMVAGDLKIDLVEVRIDQEELATEPVPNVSSEKFLGIMIGSPADLLFVDAEGRRVGFDFVTQQEVNEIPAAFYSGHGISPQLIEIPFPVTGDCHVFVSGTSVGFYHLYTLLGNLTEENPPDLEFSAFQSLNIPISASAIHQHTIDWVALSLGEEGVTVEVDSDGNGVPEYTFTSDSELTQNEFLIQTGQSVSPASIGVQPTQLTVGSRTLPLPTPTFTINVTVQDVTDLFEWKIKLNYDQTILEAVEVSLPTYNVFGADYTLLEATIDSASGFVQVSARSSTVGFNGSGVLCQVKFRGIGAPILEIAFRYGLSDLEFDSGVTLLKDSANAAIIFNWNTPAGTVRVEARALFGDLNGDGTVEGKDIAVVAKAFGSDPSNPRWIPQADLNEDGMIEGMDLAIVAKNYGKTYL